MQNSVLRGFRSLSFLGLLLVAAIGASHGEALNQGEQAPDWILPNSRGEHISFYQDSAGQPAVLMFWATWCPQCKELMGELEQLRSDLAEQGVRFYVLNIWEDDDPVSHMREAGYHFTLLLDADMVAKRYKVRGTPGLFVVDEDKTIRYISRQEDSPEEVSRAVRSALSEG